MKKLLVLTFSVSIYLSTCAMNDKSEEQKRERCHEHRIIRSTTMMNVQMLIEKASQGDIESQFALQELKDSCAKDRKVFLPPSRKKLDEIGFLDDEDRVIRAICDAYSPSTFSECNKFDFEEETENK